MLLKRVALRMTLKQVTTNTVLYDWQQYDLFSITNESMCFACANCSTYKQSFMQEWAAKDIRAVMQIENGYMPIDTVTEIDTVTGVSAAICLGSLALMAVICIIVYFRK